MSETPTGKPCPICGKPAIMRYRPFCSGRCADVDLHRWLSGVYTIPVVEEDEVPVTPEPPPPEEEKE